MSANGQDAKDQDKDQFDESPQGQYRLWISELEAAKKEMKKFHVRGTNIVKTFVDDRANEDERTRDKSKPKWNKYTADIITKRCILYGNTPRVRVSRKFGDAKDEVARVAGEIMERHLNADIDSGKDDYAHALGNCLDDILGPGLGCLVVNYTSEHGEEEVTDEAMVDEEGNELAPEVSNTPKLSENITIEYVNWADQLWSPCRTWGEMRWWARRTQMRREQLVERFAEPLGLAAAEEALANGQEPDQDYLAVGKRLARRIPLNSQKEDKAESSSAFKKDPWGRSDVWEILDKEGKQRVWLVDGMDRVLDQQEDAYELDGFWSLPKPLIANPTTTAFLPVSDYTIWRDHYRGIDELFARICKLEEAIKAVGLYDAGSEQVKRLLEEGVQNKLIPSTNWAKFSEKGGIKGAMDFLPLDIFSSALQVLEARFETRVRHCDQLTGIADIMRGQVAEPGETATASRVKSRSGAVRMQALQDEFARFASETQTIKAQLIAKFFDEETIIERANMQYSFEDPALVKQAVALLKSGISQYRIEVKPEAIAMQDFAAIKAESTEAMDAIAGFMQKVGPLVQQSPAMLPSALKLLQVFCAKLRGFSEMEGILDEAIEQAEQQFKQQAQQPKQPPPPDPKLAVEQVKGKNALDKIQAEGKEDIQRIQAETQSEAARQRDETDENIREEAGKAHVKAAILQRVEPKPRTRTSGLQR